jgi:hypothetical protein
MREEIAREYAWLAADVETPPVTRYIALRRIARAGRESRDLISDDVRVLRRYLKKVDATKWYNKARIISAKADLACNEALLKQLNETEPVLGREIINIGQMLENRLAFDQLCDLLEVNAAQRREIVNTELTDKRDFMTIASVFGAEHSATYGDRDFKCGPVFLAINAELMRVMFDTPEGREASDLMFKELFKPGGVFGNVKIVRVGEEPA